MSIERAIIGKRSAANPVKGIFISPPGIDAKTASDDQLILNISDKINQLISMGFVTTTTTVPLGLSRSPFVFLTSRYDMSSDFGYGALTGPIRPSPYATERAVYSGGTTTWYPIAPSVTATINGNGASMTLNATLRTDYIVYRNAFT